MTMLNSLSMQLPQIPFQSPTSSSSSTVSSNPQGNGLFGEMLMNAIGNVAQQQGRAETLVEDYLLGKSVTDVEVLTAIKQSELALKTMLQVRNKFVEAYKELKQIQV
jgi:flagellar hook-basal body complex protein FliE